jgi:hypothetical protein
MQIYNTHPLYPSTHNYSRHSERPLRHSPLGPPHPTHRSALPPRPHPLHIRRRGMSLHQLTRYTFGNTLTHHRHHHMQPLGHQGGHPLRPMEYIPHTINRALLRPPQKNSFTPKHTTRSIQKTPSSHPAEATSHTPCTALTTPTRNTTTNACTAPWSTPSPVLTPPPPTSMRHHRHPPPMGTHTLPSLQIHERCKGV